MRESTLLRQFFLPPSSIKIGRFVCNVDSPHQDYYDPTPPLEASSIIENLQAHYTGSEALDNHRTFASNLTSFSQRRYQTAQKLQSASLQSRSRRTTWITAGSGSKIKYNSKTFANGSSALSTKASLFFSSSGITLSAMRRIETQNSEGKGIGSQLTAPLSTALAASGVIVPVTDLLDPSVCGSTRLKEEKKMKFKAPGEQVLAVQYRKVRFRFLSSKSVDKATLEKQARWMRFDRPRYLRSEGGDMVEIELDDRLEPQGGREEYNVSSDEIIYVSG